MIEKILNVFETYVSRNDKLSGTYQTKDTDQEKEICDLLLRSGVPYLGHGSQEYKKSNPMTDGFYTQPHGTQNNPDIVIHHQGKSLGISCKSAKDTICFNSTRPNPDVVYVIDNGNHRCVQTGSEIVSEAEDLIFKEYENELKELCGKIKDRLKEVKSKIVVYERKAYYANTKLKTTNLNTIQNHLKNKLKGNND
jgi:hypothetical protein